MGDVDGYGQGREALRRYDPNGSTLAGVRAASRDETSQRSLVCPPHRRRAVRASRPVRVHARGICVPALEVRAFIEDYIRSKGSAVSEDGLIETNGQALPVIETLAKDVTRFSRGTRTVDSVKRMLTRIRRLEGPTCAVDLADAILLACNRGNELRTLTHLAPTLPGAREAVEAYTAEIAPLSTDEQDALTRSLVHFSRGVIADLDELTPQSERERANARKRERARKKRELAAVAA
jgi:hypothetical protein